MKQWALLTGASTGIGAELARLFAADNISLVLVARDKQRLEKLGAELTAAHGIPTRICAGDLAMPGSAKEIHGACSDLPISILVNNAGFGHYGHFAKAPLKVHLDIMQVNMVALVELTHRFLPQMIERRSGRILNVASLAAFQPGPTVNIYYASKAFVYSFSYALAVELKGTGVTVTALCPGTTRTEFFERAGIHMRRPFPLMSARRVAEVGYRAMLKGKRTAFPGLVNRLMAAVSPCVPARITAGAVKRIHETRS